MYLLTGVVKGVRPTKFTPLARKIKRQTANPGLSGEMAVKTMWVTACISRGYSSQYRFLGIPVGIFQVGSVFIVGFSKYHDIGSVFLVSHFASKRHVQILKFCFRVSPEILTEDRCQRSCRWQKLAIRSPHERRLPVAEAGWEWT